MARVIISEGRTLGNLKGGVNDKRPALSKRPSRPPPAPKPIVRAITK